MVVCIALISVSSRTFSAEVRKAIDDGTYGKKLPQLTSITLQQLADRYTEDYVMVQHAEYSRLSRTMVASMGAGKRFAWRCAR